MKLHKRLIIAGQDVHLIREEVRLELQNPGRASFTVHAQAPLQGAVSLDLGYNNDPLQRLFTGQVERCVPINAQQQQVYCRELTAVLHTPMPLALRHADLAQVLGEIGRLTGMELQVPEAAYARHRAPCFYSLGNGLQAVDSLRQVFAIDDFVWQQQSDGRLFAGAWADSEWGQRAPLDLPPQLFEAVQGNQRALIAALPGLRPGASFNHRQRIVSITLSDSKMAVKWKTQ